MQLLKGKNILPAILFLVVVILVILMVSNTSYVPYTRNEMFPKYGTYEGLTSNIEVSGLEGSSLLQGTTDVQGNTLVIGNTDVKGNTLVSESAFDSPSSVLSSLFGKSAEGFSGSVTTNMSQLHNSEIIDRFSHVSDTSSNNDSKCPSGGLSNSKGALCLTPELVQLLKTRGGNM